MKNTEWYYVDEAPRYSYRSLLLAASALLALYYSWTLYRMCSVRVEQEVAKDRIIAASSACNEQLSVFSQRLDCIAVQENLDSRTQTARVNICWAEHMNPFQSWKFLLGVMFCSVSAIVYTLLRALVQRPAPVYYPRMQRLNNF
jgi:hypothetical protein